MKIAAYIKLKEGKKTYIILIAIIISTLFLSLIQFLNIFEEKTITKMISISNEPKNSSQVIIPYSNEPLINPGKGFVIKNTTASSIDNIISIGYYRFDWCQIEPEEGVYNWNIIDDKITEFTNRGKKFAFGIMNANTFSEAQYVTPEWVFNEGAESITIEIPYKYNDNQYFREQTIPIWTDKIFLEKVNNFIKVLGERYNGNENIAFIDIRSYGNWGEQHLFGIGGTDISSEELRDLYIKPYIDAFPNTLLVNPWGKSMYNDTYEWAIEQGVTIRRDGIFEYSDGSECLIAYGKLPTIYEYTYDYDELKSSNLWNTDDLLEYVNVGKPSYIEISPDMYAENKEFFDMLANKIGYYFRLKEASFTDTVQLGSDSTISLKFINEGVAPLYENCTVYIGLLDENYNLVKKYKTDINPHTWMPNEEKQENINITFNGIEIGNYIISLGLFLNENDEKPTYLLGNEGKTNDKWYILGDITISQNDNIDSENQENIINSEEYTNNTSVNKEDNTIISDEELPQTGISTIKIVAIILMVIIILILIINIIINNYY